jgi:dihydroorotate dehydrogenase (NAD+) catalytic subunit
MKNRDLSLLQTRMSSLSLRTPWVMGSGVFGYGFELKGIVDYNYIGAIITKTVTLNPRLGNDPPRLYETPYGLLNTIGLANIGIERFKEEAYKEIEGIKKDNPDLVFILSIGGESVDEYLEMMDKASSLTCFSAYELNVSCPNVALGGKNLSQEPETLFDLIKKAKASSILPIIIKISPESQITDISKGCERAGADILTISNTFVGTALTWPSLKFVLSRPTGGYSGEGIFPLALARVYMVRSVVNLPVIASGGLTNLRSAASFISVGADAVTIGSSLFKDYELPKKLSLALLTYLEERSITLTVLKGSAKP